MPRLFLAIALSALIAAPALGQSLSERIAHVRQQRAAGARAADPLAELRQRQRNTANQLRDIVETVSIEDATARDALRWWSDSVGVSLVIHWESMELAGVDPDTRITLNVSNVPAGLLLELLLRLTNPDVGFVYEVEPGFVQVMTKEQANRQPVTFVYDVTDLLMNIPSFDNAPSFDLTDALSNTSSGGGGRVGSGGSGEGLFGDEDEEDEERPLTRTERGEQLAQLVRDTIEPTIWVENGGQYASVRYFRNMLVVRAPRYVHRQIGMPVRSDKLPPIGGQVGGESTF